MKIGFTGTRKGMTEQQRRWLINLIQAKKDIEEFHHGDCIGSDAEADAIFRAAAIPIVIHPPKDPKQRAFKAQSGDVVWEPLDYHERNHDIVDETDLLIATPGEAQWKPYSGTWATINYAKRLNKPVLVIAPSGSRI